MALAEVNKTRDSKLFLHAPKLLPKTVTREFPLEGGGEEKSIPESEGAKVAAEVFATATLLPTKERASNCNGLYREGVDLHATEVSLLHSMFRCKHADAPMRAPKLCCGIFAKNRPARFTLSEPDGAARLNDEVFDGKFEITGSG